MKKLLLLVTLIASLTSLSTLLQAQKNGCPEDTLIDIEEIYPLLVHQGFEEYGYEPARVLVEADTFASLFGSVSAKYVFTELLWACDGDDLSLPAGGKSAIGRLDRTFYNKKNRPVFMQRVWLIDHHPFTEHNITWPKDLLINLQNGQHNNETFFDVMPDDLAKLGIDSSFIWPTVVEGPYTIIGMHHDDEVVGGYRNPHQILRTWRLTDWCQYAHGRVESAIWEHTQTISFTDSVNFSEAVFSERNIAWPENFTCTIKDTTDLASQLAPEKIGWQTSHGGIQYTSEPQIALFSTRSVGVHYSDTIVPQLGRVDYEESYMTFFEVHRTWSVIDWDRYNRATGDGIWTHKQILKLRHVHKRE